MKTILLLKFDKLSSAPRVNRTYDALIGSYNIITAGYSPVNRENEIFIDLSQALATKNQNLNFHLTYPKPIRKIISFFINVFVLKKYNRTKYYNQMYWSNSRKNAYSLLVKHDFDVLIAHGIDALPLAVRLASIKKAKLVFNAHEYYPKEFEEDQEWVKNVQPFYFYLCKQYLSKVNLFINVSEGIRQEYLKNFGQDSIVISNASKKFDLEPSVSMEKIRVIHHGAAIKGRKIELMIECANHLDERFTLDLMLVPTDKSYLLELEEKVKNNPKVKIIPSVPFDAIVSHLNQYDIGLYILPKSNFNNEMALPNKFFEFVQARLMLALSPNPEMARIVSDYGIGIFSSTYDAESLAGQLNELSIDDVNRYKSNSHRAALILNSEVTGGLLLESINNLFFIKAA